MARRRKLSGFQCPDCHRNLRPLDQMTHAIQIVKRTCYRCKSLWQIKVTPIPSARPGILQFDVGEFTKIGRAPFPPDLPARPAV